MCTDYFQDHISEGSQCSFVHAGLISISYGVVHWSSSFSEDPRYPCLKCF
ncbi:UNVERIFIED_CONTAM: hypothetical protein FKN15_001457 [Acipenser sinensis]